MDVAQLVLYDMKNELINTGCVYVCACSCHFDNSYKLTDAVVATTNCSHTSPTHTRSRSMKAHSCVYPGDPPCSAGGVEVKRDDRLASDCHSL